MPTLMSADCWLVDRFQSLLLAIWLSVFSKVCTETRKFTEGFRGDSLMRDRKLSHVSEDLEMRLTRAIGSRAPWVGSARRLPPRE